MKNPFRVINILLLCSILAFSLGIIPGRSAKAQDAPRVCIPTCSETDGRMLTVASEGYITLAGQMISVEIAVPGSLTSYSFGFFDGDTGGMWDNGTVPLSYKLYANPQLTHDTSMLVTEWDGTMMADNAWTDITLPQDSRALAPGGDYFYFLLIELPNAATIDTVSNFKLRSNSPIELATDSSFAYVIPLTTMAEFNIIYPGGFFSPSTYDGTWDLYLNVQTSSPTFSIWDGDTDFGSYNCTDYDTNDLDTPDDILPPWVAGISDHLEGVATTTSNCMDAGYHVITGPDGELFTSGNPADDTNNRIFLRSPSVTYTVTDPNGIQYKNENPSGNQEWEQFMIAADPDTLADFHVDGLLPAGIYHIKMTGLDMHNLNAWHLISGKVVCVYEDGTPCVPVLHPYKIGDTIWFDGNGNGIQDYGEAGIPGVSITLLDANGLPLPDGTAITDLNGHYTFGVDTGTYSVQVDGSNFEAGGPLSNMVTTTGGELQTNAVTTDNVFIYDFGYVDPTINFCGYIRTPGFWKNYQAHMTYATFESLLHATQDFNTLTVQEAVAILGTNSRTITIPGDSRTVDARFIKFLLAAEINAVWNGRDNEAGLAGFISLGSFGYYQGSSLTINQLLRQIYLDRFSFSTQEYNYVVYLAAKGEYQDMASCLVKFAP